MTYTGRMYIYSTREARADLSTILQAALDGETTIVERDGAPVAKIAPLSSRDFAEWQRTRAAERNE